MTKNIDPAVRLREHFSFVREQSVRLCAPLQPEDYTVQPHPDVSPPKWHLGHTTWFFENFILAEFVAGYALFDARLNWFFNSYYESQGPRILRTSRGNMTRPALSVILAYRRHVNEAITELLERDHERAPHIRQLVELGLHHEQQHQELLVTDIKFILGTNPLYPAYRNSAGAAAGAGEVEGRGFPSDRLPQGHPDGRPHPWNTQFISVKGGVHRIGHTGPGFSWDNEHAAHSVLLEDFLIADRTVTNGEYLAFMAAGGYEQFEYWQMEGIEWARGLAVGAPLYWNQTEDGTWMHYTLNHGLQPVDPDLPVTHVSWYEADAYARWADARLPTEFEWEVACRQLDPEVLPIHNWVENEELHPTAKVDTPGFLGDTWEWTNSSYLPYPRYPRPAGALGEYNGKFMVNQMVLRGGSCATPQSHARLTYRNFFQTDKRWQFTGIRLAKDIPPHND